MHTIAQIAQMQNRIDKRVITEAVSTLLAFRNRHTAAYPNLISYTHTYQHGCLAAICTFDTFHRSSHIVVKGIDACGLRNTLILSIVLHGLESRHEWGNDWAALTYPHMVDATMALYQHVQALLPEVRS